MLNRRVVIINYNKCDELREAICSIHECAVLLHDIHVSVKDVPVHELFSEWYDKMLSYYDSFREWAFILNIDTSHSIKSVNVSDIVVAQAYACASDAIVHTMEKVIMCISDDNDATSCGIRSDAEEFCSYWSKVALYKMR